MKWRLSLLALALVAPASRAQLATNPIALPDALWAFDGFAIKPPQHGEWLSLYKSRDRAAFVRAGEAPDDTLVAAVVAIADSNTYPTREAFLKLVSEARGKAADGQRYRLISHQEELEPGAALWCTRYTLHGEEQRSISDATWVIDIEGRSCWNPQARLRIDLSLTERSPIDSSESVLYNGDFSFLQTLRLYPHHIATGAQNAQIPEAQLYQQATVGDPAAALQLAQRYQQRGEKADSFVYWYRFAAERGEADAQYNLGVYYDQAKGGDRDVAQAVYWFKRAADQRDVQAQLNLGILYYKGDGIQPDREQAQYWLGLAAINHNKRALQLLMDLDFETPVTPAPSQNPTQPRDTPAQKPD